MEIIVSIAILAIIVLLFECICHSYKGQCKGKKRDECTHLATNIMEGIEKNSMKTLAYKFNYPSEGLTWRTAFIYQMEAVHVSFLRSRQVDNVKRLEDISAEIVNKDDVITSVFTRLMHQPK